MKITSFAKTDYKGHEIYVRTFSYYFEFLTVHKGKIHTTFVPLRPDLKNRMLYLLGRQELPYSEEQLDAAKKMMVHLASQVIDELSNSK